MNSRHYCTMSEWEERTMIDAFDIEYERLCDELGIKSQEQGEQLVNDYNNDCQYAIDLLDEYSLEEMKILKGDIHAAYELHTR